LNNSQESPVVTSQDDDDNTIETKYPEIDNKTRKKKKNAEDFLTNFVPSNDAREEHTITLDTSPLNVPTFIQVTEIALQRLPDVIKVYQEKNLDTSGMDFYERWNFLEKNNAFHTLSEWEHYLKIIESSIIVPSNDPSIFWNENKDKFPHLANFARLLFGRPTSTGSVERLFSMLGNMSCRQRNSKGIKNMELYQIFKEYALKRCVSEPKRHKYQRRNYKKKEQKRLGFGTFDPNGYMTEQQIGTKKKFFFSKNI